MGKIVKVVSDCLFVGGLLIAALFLIGHFTGRKPVQVFIVSSGSMEPAVSTGSLVLVSPKPNYNFGDIVTFYNSSSKKTTTTHRIIGLSDTHIRTMGDANNQPDTSLTDKSLIIGSVLVSVPYVGYLAAFAKTPYGFILLVIVPATIIIYEEIKALALTFKNILEKFTAKPPTLSPSPRIAVVVPVFFAVLITLSISVSFFVDRETSAGNVLGATATSPTPSVSPTPTSTPAPTDPFADLVTAVTGTFGHCCDANNLSSDPAVAATLVTGAPDSPLDFDFIQISDSSSITLRFVDNKAVDGPGPDVRLHVFDAEFPGTAQIELSSDCLAFTSFGLHPDTADVDLDLQGSGLSEAICIRLTDQLADGDPFPTLGFDLDAAEALNSIVVP